MLETVYRLPQRQPENGLLSFCIEQYAYLVIVSSVTFEVAVRASSGPLLSSLHRTISGTSSHGVMFGSAHDLFGLILPIRRLASERAKLQGDVPIEIHTQCISLQHRILGWSSPRGQSISSFDRIQSSDPNSPEEIEYLRDAELAALIYQQACLVYLYTAYHGPCPPTSELLDKIVHCSDLFMPLFLSLSNGSPSWSTMMWPALVVGSCLQDGAQRKSLLDHITSSPFSVKILARVTQLLSLLWRLQEDSPLMFGPYGIEAAMNRAGVRICMG